MGQMNLRVDELIKARELRDGRRVSVAELAHSTGIAPTALAAMVDNRIDTVGLADLGKLCDYFGCTAGELLYYDPDPETLDEDEMESRDIVARWERTFGADEHPPE